MKQFRATYIILCIFCFDLLPGCFEEIYSEPSLGVNPSIHAEFSDASVASRSEVVNVRMSDDSREASFDVNASEKIIAPENPFENIHCPIEKSLIPEAEELFQLKADAKQLRIAEEMHLELEKKAQPSLIPSKKHLENQAHFFEMVQKIPLDGLNFEEREAVYGAAKEKFFEENKNDDLF